MLRYAAKRLLELIPTTAGILLLTFLLFHVIGGSPALSVLGKNATAQSIAAFNAKYGYDQPIYKQFTNYVVNLAKGDFGVSTELNEPVADILKRGAVHSLKLTVPILIGGSLIALMLAMVCAAFREKAPDKTILFASTVLMSVNYVVWILAGQFIFAFKLHLFPIWGCSRWTYYALPVAIGIISSLGADVRFYRTAVLDETYKPYVRTALSKGLSGTRIMFCHILRNSLIPVVTYISLSIPFLFTGSLMLESFFGIPGLGNVSLNAMHSADMAVVRAVVVLGALFYQLTNLATDLLYAWLDPRVRLG